MAASDSEDEHGETWQYAPAPEQARATLWQVAEVLALVAGVMALAIAGTSPLTVVHRAPGDLVSDMEVGSVQGDEMRLMRMQPVQSGSGADTGDAQSSEIQSPEMLTRERALRAAAERHVHDAQVRLGAAERAAQEARRELEAEQTARQATTQRLSEVSEELARERTAKEAAELAAKEAMSRKPKGWRLLKVERWTW
jgi:hypothetical protein